jgi:hypothetical protein
MNSCNSPALQKKTEKGVKHPPSLLPPNGARHREHFVSRSFFSTCRTAFTLVLPSSSVTKETESEDEPESEEDQSYPYALEGKYIDESDRQR